MKKTILTLLIVSLLADVFALPPPPPPEPPFELPPPPGRDYRNFHGKRMGEHPMDFQLMMLKVEEDPMWPDTIAINLFFSGPLNVESISAENFLVNGKIIEDGKIQFSKSGTGVRLLVPSRQLGSKEQFSFCLKDVGSINGQVQPLLEFSECSKDCGYGFLMREKIWKKF